MKRIGLIGVSFGMILLLTGCGNTKTLTCTMQRSEDGTTGAMGYRVTYKDDVISVIEEKMAYEGSGDDYLSQLDDLEKEFNEGVSEHETDGVKYDLERDGNRVEITVTYDLNKMTEEEREDIDFSFDDDNSYETVKSNFESQGMVCE